MEYRHSDGNNGVQPKEPKRFPPGEQGERGGKDKQVEVVIGQVPGDNLQADKYQHVYGEEPPKGPVQAFTVSAIHHGSRKEPVYNQLNFSVRSVPNILSILYDSSV